MRTRVWEIPVRVLHLGLIVSCAIAMSTGDSARWGALHTAAGTLAVVLVALRIGWGFVGERWARWSSLGREPGHDPRASISILTALGGVLSLGVTGALVLGGEEMRGWLAGWPEVRTAFVAHTIHGLLAWAGVLWLGVHLIGVAHKSLSRQENLAWSMIDGRKRYEGPAVRARAGAAFAMIAASALAVLAARSSGDAPIALVQSERWNEACGECHLAFHPSLLPAASWERMLAADEHFGEILGLAPDDAASLRTFAAANAAEQKQTEHAARAAAESSASLRITDARWWQEIHGELPEDVFQREEVGGKLRCGACHEDSEQGTFDGRAAEIPPARTARRFTWRSP